MTEQNARPRFKIGDTVRVTGSQILVTIADVHPSRWTTRYRIEGRKYLYFENDLAEVPA